MPGNQHPDAAGMQRLFQAGQSFAQGFMSIMAATPAARTPGAAPAEPFPGSDEIARLRQELAAQHAALWSAMLGHKQGAPLPSVVAAEPGDGRFAAPEWTESPYFGYLRQAYLINASFLKKIADAVPIQDAAHKSRLRFATRQYVDALAPSNFAATNPEFVRAALETKGASITAGIKNLLADLEKGRVSMTDDSAFEVGRNLATTPGQVIFENELIQLIQYAPATAKTFKRPLLIVPPCINKFYVLDLQAENSFVRYAVEQGVTVFLVSWRNPQADLGHVGWDDYLEKGVLRALAVTQAIGRSDRINALGFCVGGTLLASALAVARSRGKDPVASLTLLATLLDFSDGGEIMNFVDEASVAGREATIGKGGLLKGAELAAAFSSLRANDLIWQYVVGNYLKGGRPKAFDLLYWNADSTNLPGPFAAWYLRHLYLENALRVPGRLPMCGTTADLGRIGVPTYLLATREDHIVPWRTSYLSREILGGETTFVLGASGHIAGVVNPAAKNRRSHWTGDSGAGEAEEWLAAATEHQGSWWPHWIAWLGAKGGGERAAPRVLGNSKFRPIEPAPGRYVKEKA